MSASDRPLRRTWSGEPFATGTTPLHRSPTGTSITTKWTLTLMSWTASSAMPARLGQRDFKSVRSTVDALVAKPGLPQELQNVLAPGLLEGNLKLLEEARRRSVGIISMMPITGEDEEWATSVPATSAQPMEFARLRSGLARAGSNVLERNARFRCNSEMVYTLSQPHETWRRTGARSTHATKAQARQRDQRNHSHTP